MARFDVTTGEVLSPPATIPLPTYEVKVEGNRILVGIDVTDVV
jgi:nitrite reductase/ring-hydroxylating ferredoxin subunit